MRYSVYREILYFLGTYRFPGNWIYRSGKPNSLSSFNSHIRHIEHIQRICRLKYATLSTEGIYLSEVSVPYMPHTPEISKASKFFHIPNFLNMSARKLLSFCIPNLDFPENAITHQINWEWTCCIRIICCYDSYVFCMDKKFQCKFKLIFFTTFSIACNEISCRI